METLIIPGATRYELATLPPIPKQKLVLAKRAGLYVRKQGHVYWITGPNDEPRIGATLEGLKFVSERELAAHKYPFSTR